MLPKSSKAVYPVIACHCNKRGYAFPGEQTIASLAGISDKTARSGIHGLERLPTFSWKRYKTKNGNKGKKFKLVLAKRNRRGEAFPFYKFVLESGAWSELLPIAKALYPVMRCFSYFNKKQYLGYEDYHNIKSDIKSDTSKLLHYEDRDCEFCEYRPGLLSDYAGIHRSKIKVALENLQENLLIEPDEYIENTWRVFLKNKR